MVGIYKITNTLNEKCYIGQSIDIETRWTQHIYASKYYAEKGKLYPAIKENGLENFTFEVIEQCDFNDVILNERERYWIEYYHSFEDGYNSTRGGRGIFSWKFDPEMIRKLWDDGLTIKEIAMIMNCGKKTVRKRLSNHPTYNETISRKRAAQKRIQEKIDIGKEYFFNNNIFTLTHVYQYDIEGNYLNEYNSFAEAARKLNLKPRGSNSIRTAALHKNNQQVAYGYRWDLKKFEKLERLTQRFFRPVKCIQTGQVFNSTGAAAKWCGLKSAESVRLACKGVRASAGKHPITGEKLSWTYI